MAPVKPTKVAVESTDDSDELADFELQAAFLFDEFLRLYTPADAINDERRDSPVPMPAPQSNKAVEQGYVKYNSFADDDSLECDCAPLPAPKAKPLKVSVQEEGGVRNGSQTSPTPLATSSGERVESDFVAQGQEPTSLNDDQAQKLKEVAAKLQGAGDQLVRQYGPQMGEIENTLITFVRQQGTQLTYNALARAVEQEVERGTDISFTTFMMTLHLSKTVCQKVGSACDTLQGYFRHYVAQRYGGEMRQAGSVENFAISNRAMHH